MTAIPDLGNGLAGIPDLGNGFVGIPDLKKVLAGIPDFANSELELLILDFFIFF